MSRYARPTSLSYLGPGPMTPAVKWIIWANVAVFVARIIYPRLAEFLGLIPEAVIEHRWIWQPVTYMFVHEGFTHILFNMLGIWMFGVELERKWGTQFFLQVLRDYRRRRGPDDAHRFASSVRGDGGNVRIEHRRRLRGSLRDPARLRPLLPGAADPDVHALPDPGEDTSS